MAYRYSVETEFLNVDLDVEAAYDLAPLANALTPAVHVLYCEKVKRGYFARLELARQPKTPDEAIRKLTSLVARLPAPARRLWSRARKRDFSIGVQSGSKPWCSEFPLRSDTLASAARVGARVVLTVYGEPGAVSGPDGVVRNYGPPNNEMQRTRPTQAMKPRR